MANDDTEKNRSSFSRREVLKAITAVPAAAMIPLSPALVEAGQKKAAAKAAAAVAGQATAYQPKILNAHEYQTVRVLSDWIIPADERTGSATQAGVPEFIDDWLEFTSSMSRPVGTGQGRLLSEVRGGLLWLDMECSRLFSHDFIECSEAQQKQVLDRIAYPKRAAPEDANAAAFFTQLRDLVVSGFYSSKMGVEDLQYMGNTMVPDWQGCPPEVLARLGLKGGDKS